MFLATLKNRDHPKLEYVEIGFPISEDLYEEAIHVLNEVHTGAALEQDCCIEDICSTNCPALRRLVDTIANVDELDWLGKQL